MDCPGCGGAIAENAKFCGDCGHKVREACSACGALVGLAVNFCPDCGSQQSAAPAATPRRSGENRQVTVMFLDLVDSTKFSQQFDAEDWRQVLLSFQQASVAAIERFGGHVSSYMGDGMMVLFGYPVAQEDAPLRAALAGLDVLKQVASLNRDTLVSMGIAIKIRIGIHSGRVVAGEMGAGAIREELAIVGVVPNIAARLESMAPHDSVVVSADMKRLIATHFQFESLGEHELRGISEPMEVFRLVGPLAEPAVARPAIDLAGLPLSGREAEVDELAAVWRELSERGDTRLVSIVGEPGIGKTGLIGLFLQVAAVAESQVAVLTCSAFDRDSSFGPVKRMIATDLGLGPEATPDDVRREFGKQEPGLDGGDVREALAGLFLVRPSQTGAAGGDSSAARRGLFRALQRYLSRSGGPILLILEDAHWADPSTVELVDRILRQSEGHSVMVLVVTRPFAAFPWNELSQRRIRLRGLSAAACEALIRRLTGGLPLERRLLDWIMTNTDGVPLFIEEMTKSLLEGGQVVQRQGRLELPGQVGDLETPATIQDLLTVRLDKLGSAKDLVQVAAVIGVTFDREALAFVSQRGPEEVGPDLENLVRLDFLIASSEEEGEVTYRFRHALYQKAAYDSLLRRRRQELHSRYLEWLERDPVSKLSVPSGQLAFHSERAGLLDQAARHWIAAGEVATSASAAQEAVRYLESAGRVLGELPDSAENQTLALQAQALLGGALIQAKGPGAVETQEAYRRALALCEGQSETPWHFPAYWGWWRTADNFTEMLRRAERLVAVAETMKEPEFGLQAHHCNWVNAFMVGDHETCLSHAERGLTIYEKGQFSQLGSLYGGHDPKVCSLGETALSKWLIGQANDSLEAIGRATAWAKELGHLGSRLHALDIAVMLHHYRRDPAAVLPLAQEMKAIGESNELDDYRAKSMIFEGWCRADGDDLEGGAALLDEGLRVMRDVGTREDFPVYFAALADCRTRLGHPDAAIELLDEGLAVIAEEGVAYWAAEIHRLSAEACMSRASPDPARVNAHLSLALKVARSQGALSLELRAAHSMARWLKAGGETAKALALLEETVGRFTQGRDTRDLVEAGAAIEALKAEVGPASHVHA